MKKNIYLSLITLSMLAASCGQDDQLAEKKEALSEKKSQMRELKAEISELESEIAALDPEFARANRRAALVTTKPVVQQYFEHFVEVRGEVRSNKNVSISAEAMGMINRIPVEEGQQVRQGEVLLNINASVLRNNIEEVKTQLELARSVFERQKNLWDQNIGSEIQFLEAKTKKEGLERQLATLQAQLNQSVLRAPFSGTIEEIMVREGEMTSVGMPLLRLVSLQDMYIKADVSENYIGSFKKGDEVEVHFPALNRRITTTLASVGQVIDPRNRTFTIEARLPGDTELLKPNLLAVLQVKDFEAEDAIVIPTNLIQRDGKGEFVYVVEQQAEVPQAKKKHIETGITYQNQTMVKSGLSADDTLIDQGFREVVDGMNLQISGEEAGLAIK
jgi:membrane fusion protein (multidrug efflux system)